MSAANAVTFPATAPAKPTPSLLSVLRRAYARGGAYCRRGRPLLGRGRPARERGRAARAAATSGRARGFRRPDARPGRGIGPATCDRGGSRPLLDLLRTSRQREDDARADRRRLDRLRLRGAVGGVGDGKGRAGGARTGAGAARD